MHRHDAQVTFTVQIDEMLDGRPTGTVQLDGPGAVVPFDGWVALLRILEEHAENGLDDGRHDDEQGDLR